jgi:SAM-dependent methyltransferase
MPRQAGTREVWEAKWAECAGPQFDWYLSEPPTELVTVMKGGTVPSGAALDLGCGDGVATRYIARFLRPAVGVDIALAAARRATGNRQSDGANARFVVAEVPTMPFHEGRTAFVFDRGCLQQLPARLWGPYFSEIERLLRPGGVLQLYVAKPDPSTSGVRGRARAAARRLLRRTGRKRPAPSPRMLLGLLPPSMGALETSEFPFRMKSGKTRVFVYLLARKRV